MQEQLETRLRVLHLRQAELVARVEELETRWARLLVAGLVDQAGTVESLLEGVRADLARVGMEAARTAEVLGRWKSEKAG